MIGVIADPAEHAIVQEFFELFKTPWEYYRSDRQYEVVLCTADAPSSSKAARLVLVYGGHKLAFDGQSEVEPVHPPDHGRMVSHENILIPIYSDSVTFRGVASGFMADAESGQPVAFLEQSGEGQVARIGYDLFQEIGILLTVGQPACNAAIPALELHIALLRDLIVASGARLTEIPPVPKGYQFIACLTHDVDHPSIRRHLFDHTMFGFLYRAVFQSLFKLVAGRMTLRDFLANWTAALKLPLVYLGLARDFWLDFVRYPEFEGGPRSSFFVIPFQGDPGEIEGGRAPGKRASGYGAADIADQICALQKAGCEIGLHGIDAWHDSSKGQKELEKIRRVTGRRDIGVRMHWLYFDQQSPLTLERAGADYDSTVGYNDAVGYRAGTTQVYKPLQTSRLLELPLHIMDTALFYPTRLGLSAAEARKRAEAIIDAAVLHGGAVTVNWHDRSIAPERCWGGFYKDLVEDLRRKGAWFATASETVAWFRTRRSATFESTAWDSGDVKAVGGGNDGLPQLQMRVHARQVSPTGAIVGSGVSERERLSV